MSWSSGLRDFLCSVSRSGLSASRASFTDCTKFGDSTSILPTSSITMTSAFAVAERSALTPTSSSALMSTPYRPTIVFDWISRDAKTRFSFVAQSIT